MSKFLIFIGALTLLVGAGCSWANPSTQIVALNITPNDAWVTANGLRYYGSPLFIEVERDRDMLISVGKPGYLTYRRVVHYHLSDTGKLDAAGSIFILPFFALFCGGAYDLDENNLDIFLTPVEKPVPVKNETFIEQNAVSTPEAAVVSEEVEEVTAEAAAPAPAEEPTAEAAAPEAAPEEPKSDALPEGEAPVIAVEDEALPAA